MNTVEELRRAWTEYYAYGPDEHEARFEANARAKLIADLVRYANPCPSPDEWFEGIRHKNVLHDAQPCGPPDRCGLVQAYSDNH